MSLLHLPSLDVPAVAELAEARRWVVWRGVMRQGKVTKVPLTTAGEQASTTNPATWTSFQLACAAAPRLIGGLGGGVGRVFTGEDEIGIVDLDGMLAEEGPAPEAREIVERFDSFTEVSQSGKGLHVFARGRLPFDGARDGALELYGAKRFIAVTGDHFPGTPREIRPAQEAIDWLVRARFADRHRGSAPGAITRPGDTGLGAAMPWAKFAAAVANDPKFAASWARQRRDLRDQSLSAYDASLAALAARLAWTAEEIAGLILEFRRTQGSAKAATRPDYLDRTVARALAWARDDRGEDVAFVRETATEREAEAIESRLKGGSATFDQAREFVLHEFGVEISRVRIVNQPRPFFQMEVGGHWLDSVAQTELHDQSAFIRLIAGATRTVPRRVKPPIYQGIVSAIYQMAEETSIEELKDSELAAGLVLGYLQFFDPIVDIASLEQFSKGDLLLENKPFYEGDNLFFSLRDFLERYKANPEFVGHKAVKLMLKNLGFRSEGISGRVKRYSISSGRRQVVYRNYWLGPRDALVSAFVLGGGNDSKNGFSPEKTNYTITNPKAAEDQ